jgi:Cu/Ag efflux pump CusA
VPPDLPPVGDEALEVATMRWLIGSSLRFGRLVIAAAVAVLAVGLTQLSAARLDVYPEFSPPTVEIQTEALGLSAAEVEQLITLGLEQDLLNGVPWLDKIHSTSRAGLSTIDLTFEPGTNLYAARQMVQERMTQAHALPNVGSPPIMIQPLASTARVAMIGLSSSQVSPIDMSVLARWKIRPRLMGVPGVANVSVYGQRDRQLQVQVDPKTLKSKNVTLTQVIETAGNALWVSPLTFVEASTPGTGGFVESPNQRLAVQHISPISTPAQLANVPVEGSAAGALRLGDVSKVVQDHQPLIGDSVGSGAPTLFLVVEKFPGASTVDVTHGVEEAMADLAPGLKGITIDTNVYRPAGFIETALHNLGWVALAGGLLLLVLALFVLASWRSAVMALVVLPVSVTTALLVLHLRGATFTSITALGVAAALAVIVDDLVTDLDAVCRTGVGTGTTGHLVIEALARTRVAVVFATVAIALAALPLLVLSPLVTAFSRPLILTYLLAVSASFLVAATVTPVLSVMLLRAPAPATTAFGHRVLRLFDRGVAPWAFRPRRALIAVVVLVVAAMAVVPQLGTGSVLPRLHDRNLLVDLQAAPGTSLTEMDRVASLMSAELRTLPGVADVGAHVGRAVSSDQVVNTNASELWISLSPQADYTRTRAAIDTVVRGYPGLGGTVHSYPDAQVDRAKAARDKDVTIRVYGTDLDTLQAKAREIQSAVAGVGGLTGVRVRPLVSEPSVHVEVNLAAAQKYGLRPGDVRRDATTLTSGLIVGNLYEQSKIFDVVVWGSPQTRGNLSELQTLGIGTPDGGQVALKDIASLTVRPEPVAITHDDVLRSAEVVATVSGRDPGAVVADVRSRLTSVAMPSEYHAEVLSGAVTQQADLRRAVACVAAAVIGLLLLLQAVARSWRRAAVLTLCVPLAVVGGVLTAPLAGGIRSVGALTGLFAVLALSIRAAVLLLRELTDVRYAVPAQAVRSDGRPVAEGHAEGHAERAHGVDVVDLRDPAPPAPPAASGDPEGSAAHDPVRSGTTAVNDDRVDDRTDDARTPVEDDVLTVVRAAARARAVPAIQTAVLVAALLLPAAVIGDRAGLELVHPFAITALGGLVTLLIVELGLMPAAVAAVGRDREEDPERQAAVPHDEPTDEPTDRSTGHPVEQRSDREHEHAPVAATSTNPV